MRPDPETVQSIIRNVAEAEILPRFQKLSKSDISEKAPGDLVTIADVESEKALTRELVNLLPGSVAIGEEGVAADPTTLNALSGDQPVWIIDPVDGTHNFAHGKPCFAVIVSLVHHRQIIAGWIHDPIANTTIYAEHGAGAWEGAERMLITQKSHLSEMTGSLKRSTRHKIEQRQADGEQGLPKIIKRYRCVGREYMDLVRGKLDFAGYSGLLKPWDHVAGVLMYREAGGMDQMIESAETYKVGSQIGRGNLLLAPTLSLCTSLGALD